MTAVVALSVAIVIPLALYLWHATRRIRCPQCKSDQARLVYDENGNEFVACTDCGYRKATGYAIPND